jgi:hypothetical protein
MQIRNSRTESINASPDSLMSPWFAATIVRHCWREALMLWLLGVTVGVAVMAILVADQLEGGVHPRAQSAVSWDE